MSNLNQFIHAKPLHAGQRGKKRLRKLRPVFPGVANELWYRRELLSIVRQISRVTEAELLPAIRELTAADAIGADAMPRKASLIIGKAARKFSGLDEKAQKIVKKLVDKNIKTVDTRLADSLKRATGVNLKNVFAGNKTLSASIQKATTENVDLITSIPDEYFAKLRKVVAKGFEQGTRHETLIDEIQRIGKVTESRARLIARDQTSKLNSAFNKARQTGLGIERYEWQTAGDERVRPEHQAHDGKIFSWNDPPEDTGHPGEDIQCRCVAIPIFELE